MPAPWEKYGTQQNAAPAADGPWAKFKAPESTNAAPAASTAAPTEQGSVADTIARPLWKGITLGYGDEISGLVNRVLPDSWKQQPRATPDQVSQSEVDANASLAANHPIWNAVGQVAGNVVGGLALPGMTAASLPARLALGTAAGTIGGAVQASGESNAPTLAGRGQAALDALPYAAGGSLVGAGFGEGIGAGLRSTARWLGDRLGTQASTGRFIQGLADQAGVTPHTQPTMGGELPVEQLGDVGTQAASAVAAERGPAGAILRGALDQSTAGQRGRVTQAARDLVGTNETVPEAIERITTARRNQANQLYSAADAEATANPTAGGNAWGELTRRGHLADIANSRQFQRGLEDDFGVDTIDRLTPLQRLQGLDKEITGRISAADRSGDSNLVRQLRQRQSEVRAILDQETPTYGAAAQAYAQASQYRDALDLGKEVLRQTKSNPQFFHEFAQLSPEAQDAARLSVIEELERIMQSRDRDGRTNVLRSLDNDLVQSRLRHMFGDDFNITRESNLSDLRNAVASGSQTAQRQANRIRQPNLGDTGVSVAVDALSGSSVPLATGLRLGGGILNAQIPRIAANRANALSDWAAFRDALRAEEAARRGGASRALPGAFGIAGGNLAPNAFQEQKSR